MVEIKNIYVQHMLNLFPGELDHAYQDAGTVDETSKNYYLLLFWIMHPTALSKKLVVHVTRIYIFLLKWQYGM